MKGKTFWVLVLAFLAGGGVVVWQFYQARLKALPPGIASGNGRIESVQVDVTTKEPGRVEKILVHEGDMVHAGQVVARMDTVTFEAELARAEATVAEQEAKTLEVEADIARLTASSSLPRSSSNATRSFSPARPPARELRHQGNLGQDSPCGARRREGPANTAARSRSTRPRPRWQDPSPDQRHDPSVHCRGSRPLSTGRRGRGLGSGGKVLTLVNLGDVYMEIYLPAQDAVKIKIGADARIVLDIAPEYAARGEGQFVAPEAQFTPKQVETRSERDKLMFRVKLSVPPERVLSVHRASQDRHPRRRLCPARRLRPPGPSGSTGASRCAGTPPRRGAASKAPAAAGVSNGRGGRVDAPTRRTPASRPATRAPRSASRNDGHPRPSPDRDTVRPVASVRGVSHVYGTARALDGLDLDIPAGVMVGLIGPTASASRR